MTRALKLPCSYVLINLYFQKTHLDLCHNFALAASCVMGILSIPLVALLIVATAMECDCICVFGHSLVEMISTKKETRIILLLHIFSGRRIISSTMSLGLLFAHFISAAAERVYSPVYRLVYSLQSCWHTDRDVFLFFRFSNRSHDNAFACRLLVQCWFSWG